MRIADSSPLMLLLLAACATSETQVLPAYTLENGAMLQDVVTIGGDRQGGAPSLTAVTTYDIGTPGVAKVISREHAAGAAIGPQIAKGLSLGVPIAVGAVGAAAASDGDDTRVTNTSYQTSGNVAYDGGNAGDIDAATQVVGSCQGSDSCNVSN